MVVELRIDDRYYWLDDEFIKEVNETYGSTLTKERQYWKKEDILERNGNNDLEFLIHGQNKPCKAEFDAFTIDSPVAAYAGLEMGLYDFCGPDDAMGQMLIEPTAQTREYIEKVCQPCEPSQLVYSNDMMKYIMKAEGVDDGAVMRHNKFLLYSDYQRTPYWYHVSQRVKWVAGNRCSKCGRRDELQTHHLTYDHRGLEAKYPEDLICLCKRCHMKEHE